MLETWWLSHFAERPAADVALMNGGSIRADTIIIQGADEAGLLSILPFKNKVVKLEVSGATLRAALEHGVSRSAEDASPGDSLRWQDFVFHSTRAVRQELRVVDVTVNGQPLDDNRNTPGNQNFLAMTAETVSHAQGRAASICSRAGQSDLIACGERSLLPGQSLRRLTGVSNALITRAAKSRTALKLNDHRSNVRGRQFTGS